MKNEMVSISKNDLGILLETSLMLKDHMQYLDIADCYNIIEDGSLDSETFDETGEYSVEENGIMEDRVERYLSLLNDVIRRNIK
jgi:hypothetical protein